jgi:single-strand DNA-binding protein
MNSLNSVLLEGNLTDRPVEIRNGVCVFTVESYRYFKVGDDVEKEVSYFNVETWGVRCARELDKGRGVRVVGRLKQSLVDFEGKTISEIKIIAEHVEFKPQFDSPAP